MADTTYLKRLRRSGVKLGTIGVPLERNDRAFTDWLVSNMPTGGTIAETLVAMALDEWHDELDQ